MRTIKMDTTDRRLLDILQAGIPLVERPYAVLASHLGLQERDIIDRTQSLRNAGVIRTIRPIFEPASLGYSTTLVAARIPARRLAAAALLVNDHPGVGHNYQRHDYYNLWFTLSLPSDRDAAIEVERLRKQVRPTDMFELPALRTFKIGAVFQMTGDRAPPPSRVGRDQEPEQATASDWPIISALQMELPIVERPFDAIAERGETTVEGLLGQCKSLLDRGIIRRFGATLRHTSAGFKSNAMVAWSVPESKAKEVGTKLVDYTEVSHCYERRPNDLWPYRLFTMVHAANREECTKTVTRIASDVGISDFRVLLTVREFKKKRVDYQRPTARYYPMFIDVRGRKCVVVGGGVVAFRKVNMLRDFDGAVEVVSPEACESLESLAAQGCITLKKKPYASGDLDGASVVIAATDDEETNKRVALDAERLGLPVNVVDVPRLSGFVVPSYVRRGNLTLAISTGGRSPALARKIRTRLEDEFTEEYGALADIAGEVRTQLKQLGVAVSGEGWQEALELPSLLDLLKQGRPDDARRLLLDRLRRHNP